MPSQASPSSRYCASARSKSVKVKEALIRIKLFFEAAVERGTVATSAKIALIVGSILALINYGDRILLHGDMRDLDWFKLAVTYCVPYCVATYGAARYATRHARDKKNNTPRDPA